MTLLFSHEHYLAAAEAFLRGIEHRLDVGLGATATNWATFLKRLHTSR